MTGRKGEKKLKWSQEDMHAALNDCRNSNLTPTETAKKHNVPRKTLTDRLEKKVKDDCRGGGSGTILSKEHELALCSYIEYMAQRGFLSQLAKSSIMHGASTKKRGKTGLELMDLVIRGGSV